MLVKEKSFILLQNENHSRLNMKNIKSIKTYLFIIIALSIAFVFGFSFGKSSKGQNDFALLNRKLENSIRQTETRNKHIYRYLDDLVCLNPVKTGEWFSKGKIVRHQTDTIINFIQQIQETRKTTRISAKEIANLQNQLDYYAKIIPNLSSYNESITFDSIKELADMSPKAFVAALSKIQLDIKNNETEILRYLINQVDAGDYRVNRMEAIVIPKSTHIRLGETYSAQIVLAAVDTTKLPAVFMNGKLLHYNNIYEVKPTSIGTFTYTGQMSVPKDDGATRLFPFMSTYTVSK